VEDGWIAMTPVFAAVAVAIACTVWVTPRLDMRGAGLAAGLVVIWAAISAVGPSIAGDTVKPPVNGQATLAMIGAAALASLATLGALAYRDRRASSSAASQFDGVPAFESTS